MKIIKEYKQGFKLGGGKDSKCYLVSKDRKTFCMKKIKVAKNEQKRISKIEREIEIMKIVGWHKNIINLEDSFRLEKGEFWIYCIITEAQRMNLAQYIKSKRDGRLKEKSCKKIFKQILEVIEFLHLNLICHNDLKMENIMIDPDTLDIKLIDFGMSTMHHCEEDMKHMNELCGSPIYLSPEKFSMSQYDGRNSDLWATGVLLYKMVSSYFPFQHSDLMGLCSSICEDELQLLDDFSESLSSLLMKLLCKDPFGRISATDALQQEWLTQNVTMLNSSANCLFNSPLRLDNDVGNKPFITFPSSF